MNRREKQVDLDAERSGRQVERDVALVNLRRVTVGTGAAAAGLVGLISTGLAGKAAAAKPVARVLPSPTAAVVIVQIPVAVPVIVRVPVYYGGSTAGRSTTSTASRASGPAPAPVSGAPAPAPVSGAPAPAPAPVIVPLPPPPPPPACTSSPSMCPK